MPVVPEAEPAGTDPFAPKSLPAGEIHLWCADLDAVDPDESVLAADERGRAARMPGRARTRFARSRELLRRLLSAYGAGVPEGIAIAIGAEGKPRLAAGGLRFSLAHTGGLWLAAFAPSADVGVDVERTDRNVDRERVAARVFAPAEVEALRLLPQPAKVAAFFRAWTVREALVKARGEGMFTLSSKVAVDLDPSRPVSVRGGDPEYWVAEVPVPPGHAAAVASAQAPGRCRSFIVA